MTEKRIRALIKEILARHRPEAPEDFVALQVSRLNEALLMAYSATSADNLRAVGLVVRIVRELYHGLVAADRRTRRVQAEPQKPFALAGDSGGKGVAGVRKDLSGLPGPCVGARAGFYPCAAAGRRAASRAARRSARKPGMAPQCVGRPARSMR